MLKLNDDSIFVGQIKQLLKNFNLPDCYIDSDSDYIPKNHMYININNNMISYMGSYGNSKPIQPYLFNYAYPNFSKKLKIENLLYDRTTHRYLGNYLRFLRKVKKLDLMSMFNCFDQEPIDLTQEALWDKIKKFDRDNSYAKKPSHFSDKNYNCYRIPITKLNSFIFSVYFQSTIPLEFMIYIDNYIDNKDQILIHSKEIITTSYKKIASSNKYLLDLKDFFNIRKLEYNTKNGTALIQKESEYLKKALEDDSNIYLLVNLPKGLKSSITILDGDYISNKVIINNVIYSPSNEEETAVKETDPKYQFYAYSYNTNPQLASYENNINYLLADKIIAYLVDNPITPVSMDYDIKKMQHFLLDNYLTKIINNSAVKFKELYKDIPGYWSKIDTEALEQILMEYLLKNKDINLYDFKDNQFYYDRLPYVDNTLEEIMKSYIDNYEIEQMNGDR